MALTQKYGTGLGRRRVLSACGGYAGAAALGCCIPRFAKAALLPPRGGLLTFDIFRNGSQIGTHTLTFDQHGDTLEVHIDCSMAVGIGPLVLFRYRHHGIERWQAGRFASLDTATDNDGTPLRVTAVNDGRVIRIDATGQAIRTVPAHTLPLTHWNLSCMSAPLFNPQDGKPIDGSVTARAASEVPLASGQLVPATRFSLTGKDKLDDWYDASGIWAGLQARVTDGSILEYRRVS